MPWAGLERSSLDDVFNWQTCSRLSIYLLLGNNYIGIEVFDTYNFESLNNFRQVHGVKSMSFHERDDL